MEKIKQAINKRNQLARDKGYKNYSEYLEVLVKKRGFESVAQYKNYLARKKGFKGHAEYGEHLAQQKFNQEISLRPNKGLDKAILQQSSEMESISNENSILVYKLLDLLEKNKGKEARYIIESRYFSNKSYRDLSKTLGGTFQGIKTNETASLKYLKKLVNHLDNHIMEEM